VPSILTEVRGDAVGAGVLARAGGEHGIGLAAATRLADRRDVIDVDVETLMGCSHAGRPLGSLATATEATKMTRWLSKRLGAAVLGTATLAVAACASGGGAQQPTPTPDHPGAATSALAIQAFMAAIKIQDLDALALIWGSEKGPARDIVPADQLRKRELIMECYLQHDSYKVVSNVASSAEIHVVTLAVTRGSFTRQTTTQVVLGPGGRWYVANTELQPLRDLCSGQSSTP
jgi:hypothetical protein